LDSGFPLLGTQLAFSVLCPMSSTRGGSSHRRGLAAHDPVFITESLWTTGDRVNLRKWNTVYMTEGIHSTLRVSVIVVAEINTTRGAILTDTKHYSTHSTKLEFVRVNLKNSFNLALLFFKIANPKN
jgi:hypothetical protein